MSDDFKEAWVMRFISAGEVVDAEIPAKDDRATVVQYDFAVSASLGGDEKALKRFEQSVVKARPEGADKPKPFPLETDPAVIVDLADAGQLDYTEIYSVGGSNG